jgi:hypothetical protein
VGLLKNVGVATCLQHDYGYGRDYARSCASSIGKLVFLPGTSLQIKRLSKQELAAWLAVAACTPPEGLKADDPTFLRHVELTIAQEHRKGKIRVPMYLHLENDLKLLHNPDMRQAMIDEWESVKDLL